MSQDKRGVAVVRVVLLVLAAVTIWKFEMWGNPIAAAHDGWHPDRAGGVDFFQEWAGAKNRLTGWPVYSSQKDAYRRDIPDLGFDPPPWGTEPAVNELTAHPPGAVLVTLPFAGLSYVQAFRIWTLLTVICLAYAFWLIRRERGPGPFPIFWPMVGLVLVFSYPLREQFHHGQLNPVLMVAIVGAWVALRRGHDALGGFLIGTAAAIKLFPAFLFVVPLFQRRWRALVWGAIAIALVTSGAAVAFGMDAFRDYLRDVMPMLVPIQTWSFNISIPGFWKKLFDSPGMGYLPVQPVAHLPRLASLLIGASGLAVLAAIGVACRRANRDRRGDDRPFALAITGMLLLSPITWPHALVLMLMPLAVLAYDLHDKGVRTIMFAGCLAVLVARPAVWLYSLHIVNGEWVRPSGLWLLTSVSAQTYALVGMFVLLATAGSVRRAHV